MAARYLSGSPQSELFEGRPRRVGAICFNQAFAAHLRQNIAKQYRVRTLEDLPTSAYIHHLNKLLWDLSQENTELPYERVVPGDDHERAKRTLARWKALLQENPAKALNLQFDCIFIDEAQDLFPEEIELLHLMVRPDPLTRERSLIIFHDDAQNVYARQRPVWKDLSIDVSRGNRSKVMKECFRNTKEIVTFAFNILLGSQAVDVRTVATREFAGLAELRQSALVDEHEGLFHVAFAEREGEQPFVNIFDSKQQELEFLRSEIRRLLEVEKVDPGDILVLATEKGMCEEAGDALKSVLNTGLCKGFVLPASRKPDHRDAYIFEEDHITICTVKSAKGYEAHIVFMIGAESYVSDPEGRAEFYVGATRAKLRLYVSGVGPDEPAAKTETILPEIGRLDLRLKATNFTPIAKLS